MSQRYVVIDCSGNSNRAESLLMNACAPESGFGAGGSGSGGGACATVVSQIAKFTEKSMVVSMPGVTASGWTCAACCWPGHGTAIVIVALSGSLESV